MEYSITKSKEDAHRAPSSEENMRDAGATACHRRSTGHEALAAPRKNSVALLAAICKTDSVTEVEHGAHSRQIGIAFPLSDLACCWANHRLESSASASKRVSRSQSAEYVARFLRDCCIGVLAIFASMTQPRTGNVGNAGKTRRTTSSKRMCERKRTIRTLPELREFWSLSP